MAAAVSHSDLLALSREQLGDLILAQPEAFANALADAVQRGRLDGEQLAAFLFDDTDSLAVQPQESAGLTSLLPAASATMLQVYLAGNSIVGKTSLVKQLCKAAPEHKLGTTSASSATFYGPRTLQFEFHELPGDPERFVSSLDHGSGLTGAILMFDVTNQASYDSVPQYRQKLLQLGLSKESLVLVGNKCDILDRVVTIANIEWHHIWNIQYFDVSAEDGFNLIKPLLWLARRMTDDPTLFFT
eukprot:TRINITY_DN80825_c0_g1_i1.p1 TRINITY_DN80825_c0_g1~~TRINITY_DN80825_c0_g1_i1.p1  ORF type:complete len:262 (-),score=32.70 TRINITY_DN80825_c0_g1_i1:183-914(-)